MKRQSRKNRCGRSLVGTNILFFGGWRSQNASFGRRRAARGVARGAARRRGAASRLAACAHPPAAPRRSSRRAKFGVGCRGGEARPSVEGSLGGRTVDEQAERDGVDDDHHGHGGLALTLGAFGPGVMDELLLGASEKGAHGVTEVGYVDLVRRGMDGQSRTRKFILFCRPP